jgi:hypothetical protein
VTAAAALGAGLLIAAHYAQAQNEARRIAAVQRAALPTAGPSAAPTPAPGVITGSSTPTGLTAGGGGGAPVGVANAPISVRYTFDGGVDAPIADQAGGFPLRPITQVGGALVFAPRGVGFAMQFPARCRAVAKSCPRAILEGARVDALNPGVRPLQYGASVLMTAADTGDGANVVQKGYSVGGVSQFKLQVDHEAGRPSCVIASTKRIYRVEPKVNVANGVWHNLVCTRIGNRLSLAVDGVVAGSVAVPPTLSVANAEPLRIGGKGANLANDQFAGQIDNVFLTIG